jgi:hypothetical protein
MKLDTRKLSTVAGSALATLVLLVLALMQAALIATPALADSCPNAAERFGASANLPDCRAYELVTPAVKEDNSNIFGVYGFADGEHVVYDGIAPFPGAQNGGENPSLSYRTPAGWVARTLTPPQGPGEADTLYAEDQGDAMFPASFTENFSEAFVATPFASDPLDQNLDLDVYRINVATGAASLESLPDTGAMTESLYRPSALKTEAVPGSFLTGNSADGSRVFFTTDVPLPTAPGTPSESQPVGMEVYERHGGHTYLVGVLPNGSVPPCGAEAGQGGLNGLTYYQYLSYEAVSKDGTNVVFITPALHEGGELPGCNPIGYPQEGKLFLREGNGTPQARTIELPGLVYLGRSSDQSVIFTGGDSAGDAEGGPLYEYNIATEQGTKIGTGNFLAASANGSVVYYLNEQQMMVYDNGTTKVIPGAGPGFVGRAIRNARDGIGIFNLENLPVATSDGEKLLFLDRANLTSFNAAGPACLALNQSRFGSGEVPLEQNCDEAFIYDLASGSFTCVSCSPEGTPPSGQTELFIPPGLNNETPQTTYSLTEDGSRAFFETENALLPQDTNGLRDVYEWENGHIYLISSGQGVQGSRLDGVSRNGNDVFFQTADVLAPQVVENSTQVYDARVGGGFPYVAPVYGCDSGQCQGPQTPAPVFSPPASATFVGIGNPEPPLGNVVSQAGSVKSKHGAKQKHKSRRRPKKKAKGSGQKSGNRKGGK